MSQTDNLIAELQIKFKSLLKKYSVKLEVLSDYQVLGIQQDKLVDHEFTAILEMENIAGERILNLVSRISSN